MQSDSVLSSQLRSPPNQIPAQPCSSRETEAHTKRHFTSKEEIILIGICKVNRMKSVNRCNRHTAVYNFICKNRALCTLPKICQNHTGIHALSSNSPVRDDMLQPIVSVMPRVHQLLVSGRCQGSLSPGWPLASASVGTPRITKSWEMCCGSEPAIRKRVSSRSRLSLSPSP